MELDPYKRKTEPREIPNQITNIQPLIDLVCAKTTGKDLAIHVLTYLILLTDIFKNQLSTLGYFKIEWNLRREGI